MDYLLHHPLARAAQQVPDKEAVSDGVTTRTYTELAGRAGRVAERLTDAGLERGDRVALFLDHNVELAETIFGCSGAGGVFVPVGQTLYPQQVQHILRDSGARVLVTTEERREALGDVPDSCSDLRAVWTASDFEGMGALPDSCASISNDLAALLYTSGSTGRPKGVMFSHGNLLAGSRIVSDYLELGSTDRLAGVLPLSFDYGLNQLITMVDHGGYFRFLNFVFPRDIVKVLEEEQLTGLAGVPPMWALLAHSSLAKTPLPKLRYITNSGGAVPTRVLELLRKALPNAEVYLMYGLTEAFRSTYLPPSELDKRPTSMGKAIPDTEIMVVSEDGTPCAPGEIGELVHRGPTVGLGYWQRPEETAERYHPHPFARGDGHGAERVVYSGDLVKLDEDGFLHFVGRRDAMIKVSGYRISPSEIEEMVFASGLVKQAAAIGIPDETAGQVVKVFVVALEDELGDDTKLQSGIVDYCAEHLPNYMVPRFVEVIDAVPKGASGKVDYPALKARG